MMSRCDSRQLFCFQGRARTASAQSLPSAPLAHRGDGSGGLRGDFFQRVDFIERHAHLVDVAFECRGLRQICRCAIRQIQYRDRRLGESLAQVDLEAAVRLCGRGDYKGIAHTPHRECEVVFRAVADLIAPSERALQAFYLEALSCCCELCLDLAPARHVLYCELGVDSLRKELSAHLCLRLQAPYAKRRA